MVPAISRLLLVAVVTTAVWTLAAAETEAVERTAPGLFANYYATSDSDAVPAMYLCPRPTPPLVGHTYVTYQPLMPHEFLYTHGRTYRARRPGEGRTVTHVRWSHHYLQDVVPYYIDGRFFHNIFDCWD